MLSTSSVTPCSTISPARMTMTRSHSKAHHVEVVGDEQIAHAETRFEAGEEIEHHGLD